MADRMEQLGYVVEHADIADFYTVDGVTINENRETDWLGHINNSVANCDFLLVESVSGTNSSLVYTDAILWVEVDKEVMRERHKERGIPLTDDDLNYYDSLLNFGCPLPGTVIYSEPIKDSFDELAARAGDSRFNPVWKSVPSFILDGNSDLRLATEEALSLVLGNQTGLVLGGSPSDI